MDEREIEAVAAEAREIAAVVANDEKFHRIETLIDQLEDAAVGRVRDARGHDERSALNQTCCSGCTEAVRDEEPLRFRSGVLWHEACLAARPRRARTTR
jgi:hypothetical protein